MSHDAKTGSDKNVIKKPSHLKDFIIFLERVEKQKVEHMEHNKFMRK